MAIVEGQIEPLKELKKILDQNGITRFNSIGEINDFIKNYDSERREIPKQIENALDNEIINLQSNLTKLKQIYEDLRDNASNEIDTEIKNLEEEYNSVREKCNNSLIKKIFYFRKTKKMG